MKKKIVIEIETKEDNGIIPEENMGGDEKNHLSKEEVQQHRIDYAEDLLNDM